MSHTDTLQAALSAAENPIMLESAAQAGRAAKAWRRADLLAVDTEFVRERTYYANLGLVQVSDGQTVWLLDPLEAGTLEPLADMLADPAIHKLLHSPSEDLEVLLHVTGAMPDPLIDSQLACALLGQPLQLGYHKAAEWLLGVPIDKDLTRSNWMARPLREALLRYAALDVSVLPLMWEDLHSRLEGLGRLEWLEEDCARMLRDAAKPVDSSQSYARIKGAARLNGESLAILQGLAAWREVEAQNRNRPRGFIVPDPILVAIAREQMRDPAALETLSDLHPRARQRWGSTLTGIVSESLDAGRSLPPLPEAGPAQRHQFKAMRALIVEQAAALELEPTVLATKRDMEEILFSPRAGHLPERMQGWRRSLIGEPLLALADGD
jgi:ribonuclease D